MSVGNSGQKSGIPLTDAGIPLTDKGGVSGHSVAAAAKPKLGVLETSSAEGSDPARSEVVQNSDLSISLGGKEIIAETLKLLGADQDQVDEEKKILDFLTKKSESEMSSEEKNSLLQKLLANFNHNKEKLNALFPEELDREFPEKKDLSIQIAALEYALLDRQIDEVPLPIQGENVEALNTILSDALKGFESVQINGIGGGSDFVFASYLTQYIQSIEGIGSVRCQSANSMDVDVSSASLASPLSFHAAQCVIGKYAQLKNSIEIDPSKAIQVFYNPMNPDEIADQASMRADLEADEIEPTLYHDVIASLFGCAPIQGLISDEVGIEELKATFKDRYGLVDSGDPDLDEKLGHFESDEALAAKKESIKNEFMSRRNFKKEPIKSLVNDFFEVYEGSRNDDRSDKLRQAKAEMWAYLSSSKSNDDKSFYHDAMIMLERYDEEGAAEKFKVDLFNARQLHEAKRWGRAIASKTTPSCDINYDTAFAALSSEFCYKVAGKLEGIAGYPSGLKELLMHKSDSTVSIYEASKQRSPQKLTQQAILVDNHPGEQTLLVEAGGDSLVKPLSKNESDYTRSTNDRDVNNFQYERMRALFRSEKPESRSQLFIFAGGSDSVAPFTEISKLTRDLGGRQISGIYEKISPETTLDKYNQVFPALTSTSHRAVSDKEGVMNPIKTHIPFQFWGYQPSQLNEIVTYGGNRYQDKQAVDGNNSLLDSQRKDVFVVPIKPAYEHLDWVSQEFCEMVERGTLNQVQAKQKIDALIQNIISDLGEDRAEIVKQKEAVLKMITVFTDKYASEKVEYEQFEKTFNELLVS